MVPLMSGFMCGSGWMRECMRKWLRGCTAGCMDTVSE